MERMKKRILSISLVMALVLSLLPGAALAAPRAGGVTIDVTDYGADPTGARESSTAVIAALEYAKSLGDVEKTIYFPKGEYHFYEDYSETRELYASNTLRWDERSYANKHIGILVEGMKNVTVNGGGSLFIYHGNVCTMAAIDSENVTFTNFSEDFASPEVVDVTVEAHEGSNAAILFIPACYNFTVSGTNINWQGEISPVTGQPYWSGDNGFLSYRQYLDTVTGQSMSNGKYPFSNVSSITKVDDTHIQVVYSNADSRPQVGQCCQMRHPNPRKTPGTFFWQSKDITVSNANFYFLHGFGMVGQLSENITLDTVKCQARPGTGRTSAGFADFVQMSSIAGKVTIRNCEFADPHDDPINIHGTFLKVTDITADRRRVVVRYQNHETWGFPQYYVGDTVDFTVQNTLAHVENLSRTVVGVVNPGEGVWLDGTPRSKNNENDMKTIIVELDESLPANVTATDLVIENVTYTPEVLIENCRFTETPTRAILVTTFKKVVIQNNYFDRIRTSTIFISCDGQDWYESGRTEDVLITGNTFVAQSTADNDDKYGYSAIIMVWPTNTANNPSYQIHKNLRIEDNDFYLLDGMPSGKNIVSAKSVNGLSVKNNRFLRYTPNVSLGLTAGDTNLTVGGTQSTSLTSDGFTFANRLFRLQACKQVVFEGNTYDDGLNLGIKLDETSITTRDQVTDKDGVLVWNGDNQLPAVGQVSYFSSDPTVATVDASGVVTGVKAGTADIYAYRVAGGRTFESNHLTFTVTGEAAAKPNKIDITSDKDAVDVNGTATLTAAVDPANAGSVTWSVKPATDGAAATITSGGVLTATAPGVVEVTASLGGVTGSKLVTVNTPKGLSDAWTVEDEVPENWSLDTSTEKVTINIQSGGDWATGAGGHNYFLTTAPTGDFEAVVKLDSKTCGTGNCWCETGLVLYKDHDNYISVVRKNNGGTPKLAVNSESGGSATEGTLVNDTADTTIYLKLTKSGNSYSGYYSTNGTDWALIRTVDNSISGYKVGFMGINAGDSHGSASTTLGGFTLDGAPVSLVSTNAAPTVSDVVVTSADPLAVNYTYSDADAEDGSLIAWYVADSETGHYTRLENASSATLAVTAATGGKWVKAVVAPRDATGRYGAPVTSEAAQAPTQAAVQNDATLATLSVAGLTLSPAFDPEVTQYTVSAPASATKVTIAATATQATATVADAGEVTLSGTETEVTITVTAPNGETTKEYIVTINRAASSDATLSGLTASAGSAAITYNAATRFYEMTAGQGDQSLTFSATTADPDATIAVRFNNEEKGSYTQAPKTLPLTAGANTLELRVTAADGISTAIYRVKVTKPAASSEAELTALTVNSNPVTIPTDSNDLGTVRLGSGENYAILDATVSLGASARINVGGKAVTNGDQATLDEDGAITFATVRVVAEDGVGENIYTLALIKDDPANAQLYSLELAGLTLSPAFDPKVTQYTATFADPQGTSALTAVAAQENAQVTCETVSIYETAEGRMDRDCHFFRDVDENFVKITVTSPNGETTKEYIVNVTYEPVVYLSDLQWQSATSGWQSVRRDYDVDPNKSDRLSLLEDGKTVTYEKGLGTHANSTIVYDLSAWDYTHFTAKVGMDHSQASNTTQRLRFDVSVDGVNRYTSGDLGSTMNCETVNIDISPDAQELTLHVIYTTSDDSNAHADWADAKFSGGSIGPALAETDVPVKYIKFEHKDDPTEHTVYINGDDAHPRATELHPTFKPIGVKDSAHAISLTWTSENTAIAVAAPGANSLGQVTAATTPGKVLITATAVSGASDSCYVTVKKLVKGTPTVTGELKFGSELTASLDPTMEDYVTYTWYRGEGTSGTPLATGKTYTPVEADIGSKLTVKVAAADTATYYEGETTFTTATTVAKADGIAMKMETPTHVNCSAAGGNDGQITNLCADHAHQYQTQGADNQWPTDENSWTTVNKGTTSITGLAPGNYRVRHAEDATHLAGAPSSVVTILREDQPGYTLTVPTDLTGGAVSADGSQFTENETVTLTVVPDPGYRLKTLAVTPDSITLDDTSAPETYTFAMPASNVSVSAVFEKVEYTVVHALEHIACDMEEHGGHTARHGEEFTITLTPDTGYEMPTQLTVKTENGGTFTGAYRYEVDATDSAKRVLTFPNGVTQNIIVSGEGVPKTYTVDYKLTNGLTAAGAPQTVTHDSKLEATLTAAKGYTLPETVTVTVGGAALGAGDFTYQAGKITVEKVTGDVVITAQGVAQAVPLQSATLAGPAQVGRTLTVNVEPTLATVDCQWILVDEDGTETEIAGATGKSYVIPETAKGKTIKVRVTGTGSYDGRLTTAPSTTILAADQPFVYVTGIALDPKTAEVAAGETVTINATVTPDNATAPALAWSSDNEAIATVKDGVVTGVAEGTATITAGATDGSGVSAACTVTVTKAEPPVTPEKPTTTTTTRPSTTTTTETREDGTKVTTTTKPDGTKVETVETPDGTTAVTETKKDGTVTEKVEEADGTKSETVTKPDGTKTATVEEPDGTKAVTETKPDGSKTATVEQADGTKSETVVTAEGEATITVTDADGEELAKVEIPATIPEPETKFEDISATPWAEEAINKVAGLELVKGVGGNKYDPVTPMTRGALATVLHRLSNGKTDYAVAFKDVQSNQYYTEGVAWAAKANVVKGVSEDIFAPDQIITREQLAVMLARYAKLIGISTKADTKSLEQFADGDSTGAWAVDGMAWCVEKGILKGKGQNDLDPTANVSRAEVAVMLDRFIALIK